MRVRIDYKTLDPNTKKAIENGQLDKNQLRAINQNISEYVAAKKKGLFMACSIMLIMSVFMIISTIQHTAEEYRSGLLMFSSLIFVIPFLALLAVGWLTFCRIKSQFNNALKKGYPGSYAEFMI